MSKYYKVSEFAERIGKSASTLRRWDKEGRLVARRMPSGQRYYTDEDIYRAFDIKKPETERKRIVYCRVSSRGQLDDLASQVKAMEVFCLGAGIPIDELIKEVGGGMNFKRKKFLALIESIERGEVAQLIIAHKDRLVRFGFDFFEHFAQRHGCQIVVANQTSLSPQQEMVEDLMTIVHCFSSRLYGLRSYKKKIREAASQGEPQKGEASE
jgi:predicted site-specific integrase-resolvase